MPKRIAMWSPPRARSTLMMRVFEALGCAVLDEPFYAYWLNALEKRDDPGYEQTLARHETNWRKVVAQVLGPAPGDRGWFYQKHMAIHMLPEVDLSWMDDPSFIHCFLIRDPREVIVSMTEFRDLHRVQNTLGVQAAAELVGIPQLQRIFERVVGAGAEPLPPPIIDANDVLRHPQATLAAFCSRLGLAFDANRELRWSPGLHPADGAWAPLWYQKVFATTGLQAYAPRGVQVPARLQPVVDACMPIYERLYEQRVVASVGDE